MWALKKLLIRKHKYYTVENVGNKQQISILFEYINTKKAEGNYFYKFYKKYLFFLGREH